MSSGASHDSTVRRLDEAEGFLMLDLPERALAILESRSEWATMPFEAHFLTGEALRRLGRCREALMHLERAAGLKPGNVSVAIALGWCYKRTHRLAQAIDALEKALSIAPEEPLLHYNLSCYWSLLGDADRAIAELRAAIDLEPEFRGRIASEPDFNSIRSRPEFERIVNSEPPGY